jgi:hypothetical protein
MKSTRKTQRRRRHRGGDYTYPPPAPLKQSWTSWLSNVWSGAKQKTNTLIQDANKTLNTNVSLSANPPPPPPPTSATPAPTMGGKRKRGRSLRKKRGRRPKHGGNVADNAQSVVGENIKMAQPHSWMNYPPDIRPS